MGKFKKTSRSGFLKAIQKSYAIHLKSQEPGSPPFDELLQQANESESINRRNFIQGLTKAGVAIGMAGFLNSCRKATEPFINDESISAKSTQARIAIIGAGIAGLNCAYQLKKSGITSTVFEGSSRVSGRILTLSNVVGNGLYTECGAEFIDSGHTNMRNLATEFGLNLLDSEIPSEAAYHRDSFYIDGRYYTEDEVVAAFAPFANRIRADISSLPNDFGFNNYTADVLRFDQMSISGYFDSIGIPSISFLRKGLETAYLTEYGREVNDQTAINFLYLFTINPGNNSFNIFGYSDERYKVQGGNQKITEAIYNNIRSQVQLNKILVSITRNNSNAYVLNFADGSSSIFDMVVLTLPFTKLKQVNLSNLSLPSWKTNAIQNLGYGTNSKLLLGFNQRVWRNYQQSGYVFTNGTPANPSVYLQSGWDNSSLQPGTIGGYTVYQGGIQGEALSLSRKNIFLNQLETMWPGSSSAHNGMAKLIHWPSYTFSLGSYACWRVGQVTSIMGAEKLPVGNLFFAGEHTSTLNQGYMEGGAETGADVARSIARLLQNGNRQVA